MKSLNEAMMKLKENSILDDPDTECARCNKVLTKNDYYYILNDKNYCSDCSEFDNIKERAFIVHIPVDTSVEPRCEYCGKITPEEELKQFGACRDCYYNDEIPLEEQSNTRIKELEKEIKDIENDIENCSRSDEKSELYQDLKYAKDQLDKERSKPLTEDIWNIDYVKELEQAIERIKKEIPEIKFSKVIDSKYSGPRSKLTLNNLKTHIYYDGDFYIIGDKYNSYSGTVDQVIKYLKKYL